MSASKCNRRSIRARLWSRIWRTAHPRPAGRLWIGAGEFVDNVAPQAKEVASNLYNQGARSGQYVRQYAAQEPFAAMLAAGLIGFALGYLIRGR